MGWEDRPYYRDRRPTCRRRPELADERLGAAVHGLRHPGPGPLVAGRPDRRWSWCSAFGGFGFSLGDGLRFVAVLFLVVLLHEFGHCFTARWVGGHAEDILMTPLGGLAFASPPSRPLPTFLTVAGGPAVNVMICVVDRRCICTSLDGTSRLICST